MPKPALTATLALFVSSCAVVTNTDFRRPDQLGLTLGVSMEADVLAAEGPPQSDIVTTVRSRSAEQPEFDWASGGARHYDRLQYRFSRIIVNNSSLSRAADFILADGRLCGWLYESSDPTSSTNFDESAAETRLAAGGADRAGLIAAFGVPGGQYIYPLTRSPTQTVATWGYVGSDKPGGKIVAKLMRVAFGPNDKVLSYRVTQTDVLPTSVSRTVILP